MRVLDEVAEAIRRAGGRSPRPIVSAFGLQEQFDHPIVPKQWITIQRHLGCPLPPLEFFRDYWFLPNGFATIWDLVDHASHHHPDWEPPVARTEDAWREAQVFVGVRATVVEASGADPEDVTRETPFPDLFGY